MTTATTTNNTYRSPFGKARVGTSIVIEQVPTEANPFLADDGILVISLAIGTNIHVHVDDVRSLVKYIEACADTAEEES